MSRPAAGRLEAVAARLVALRRARKLSQRGLAAATHLALRTVQSIERGRHVPQARTVLRLATFFQIDPAELDALAAPPPIGAQGLNAEDLAIARAYNRAPTAVRRFVHDTLERTETALDQATAFAETRGRLALPAPADGALPETLDPEVRDRLRTLFQQLVHYVEDSNPSQRASFFDAVNHLTATITGAAQRKASNH